LSDAKASDDALRLPRGFHDTSRQELDVERFVIDAFVRRGCQIGCSRLRTSPVGHAATFLHGVHTAGEKVFAFEDRAGRPLMLTPDSTPGLLRWYLSQGLTGPRRLFFQSPLFRYRRQKYRNFQQIGFTLINEHYRKLDDVDEGALLLARTALRTIVNDLGLRFTMRVTDFGVWHDCLHQIGLSKSQILELQNALRSMSLAEREAWVSAQISAGPGRNKFLALLRCNGPISDCLRDADLRPALQRAAGFAERCAKGFDIPVELSFSDFHSSELQDGISFQFFTLEGKRFADGGCYGLYASNFDARITSLKSFATGIEFFQSADLRLPHSAHPDKLIVIEADAAPEFTRCLSDAVLSAGLPVVQRAVPTRISRALQKYADEFRWLIVAGRMEEESEVLSVRDLKRMTTTQVACSDLVNWLKSQTN
jgi:histidyl-tRNA synthetase